MSTRRTIRLATRGSDLARRQAAAVAEAVEERRYDVELIEVETRGDQVREELIHRLGKTGAFVRSLDEEVLSEEVDGAVHSMKDMPTDSPPELVVAGIPERATPADLLVTPDGRELADLDPGAVVGTASLRRRAQILSARPDLEIEPLRGNVDTRIEKLLAPGLQREHERRLDAGEGADGDAGENGGASAGENEGRNAGETRDGDDEDETAQFDRTVEEWFDALSEIERTALERQPDVEYDAVVLAAAGLERAGLRHHVGDQELPTASFVPSPGQGAIAVTAREGSEASEIINDALDHPRTRVETTVERVVLAELGGGCVAPIGVYAVVQGEYVHAEVAVFDRAGEEDVSGTRDLPVEEYVPAARAFAADLRERGAADLIEAARADTDEREAKRE